MRRVATAALVLGLVGCGTDESGDESATASSTPAASTTTTVDPPQTTSTTTSTPPEAVPGLEWPRRAPADAGFDLDRLSDAVALAEAVDSNCLVIVRGGEIVLDEYWNGTDVDTDSEVFSTTKSVAAAIVGAAATAGHLSIDDPASNWLTEWEGTPSEAVTIRHLLQNTSGREYDLGVDLFQLAGRPDMTAHSIGLTQQADPDTEWNYNQSAIQTLEAVLERATGEDPEAFARQHLFEPLGMEVSFWRDSADNIPLFAGMQAGCLDMARFALMSQRMGDWGGTRIIDADFMAEATTGRTDLNRAYGFLYWANAADSWDHTDPTRDRARAFWPDVPLDAFGAMGLGDQVTMVLPALDTIVVRLGPATGTREWDGVLANELTALVVDSIVD